MSDYDQDAVDAAVLEAMARLQPQISALRTRIQVLESGPTPIPINPIKVIQIYEDETEIIYEKV